MQSEKRSSSPTTTIAKAGGSKHRTDAGRGLENAEAERADRPVDWLLVQGCGDALAALGSAAYFKTAGSVDAHERALAVVGRAADLLGAPLAECGCRETYPQLQPGLNHGPGCDRWHPVPPNEAKRSEAPSQGLSLGLTEFMARHAEASCERHGVVGGPCAWCLGEEVFKLQKQLATVRRLVAEYETVEARDVSSAIDENAAPNGWDHA